MLQIAIIQLLITLSCLTAGIVVHSFFQHKQSRHWIVYTLSGLISLSCIIQWVVLVFPINNTIQLSTAVLLMLALWLRRKKAKPAIAELCNSFQKLSAAQILAGVSSWLLILFYAAGPTQMDDTESYHIQMVKWIQEYGTVPGLANLHERFGFNSSWFSGVALFSSPSSEGNSYTALNSCLSIWLSLYLIHYFSSKTIHSKFVTWAVFALWLVCFISFPILRGNAATSNYDSISAMIILVLLLECCQSHSSLRHSFFEPEWIIWPLYLVSVRILNLPFGLMVVAIILYYIIQKHWKHSFAIIALAVAILLPFLLRNYYLSGYLLYPSTQFDWWNPDWKADPGIAKLLTRFVQHYNQLHQTPIAVTEQMDFLAWVPQWFVQLYTWDKWIVYPAVGGLLVLAGLWVRTFPKEKKIPATSFTRNANALQMLVVTMLFAMTLWFFVAPDPRFIYGILLSAALLFFSCFFCFLKIPSSARHIQMATLLAAVALSGFTVYKLYNTADKNIYWQATKLPAPALKQVTLGNGISVNIPEVLGSNWNARCYGSTLPCAYRVDPRLRLRGSSLEEGFKLDYNVSDSTREIDLIYLEN